MSTDNTPDDIPDDIRDSPDASAPGAALDKRPCAAVATRPTSGLDRAGTGRKGGSFCTPGCGGATDDGSSRSGRAREVLRWLVRNSVLYPLTGVWVLTRRWWEARTNARYERQMRAAEAAGDQDRLTEWEARAERAREQRHRRRMDWITAPIELARTAAVLLLWCVGALLGLGAVLAVAHTDLSWVLAPLGCRGAGGGVAGLAGRGGVAAAADQPGRGGAGRRVAARPPLRRAARAGPHPRTRPGGRDHGHHAGRDRHRARAPGDPGVEPGGQGRLAGRVLHPAGAGQPARLPGGVLPPDGRHAGDDRRQTRRPGPQPGAGAVGGVARRRRSRRLRRSVGGRSRRQPNAPPRPTRCCTTGRVDVFDGVPLGVSQRGDVIAIELPGANLVYGGLMGQGKSNAARVTMLGAALDPLAVLWVFVFANNGDFDAYQPRLARYHRGVDDHDRRRRVGRVAGAVRHGRRPRGTAGRPGREEGHPHAGREVSGAAAGGGVVLRVPRTVRPPRLRPGGRRPGRAGLRRGRKTAITLAFDTQSSRADAIPPRIVELVKINACFAVKAWRSNDGFLGDGSFQAGIRATELRPGKDVGTSIVTGATPERFEIVKWFYIEADDDTGYDAATDVIARAMTYLDRSTPIAEIGDAEPAPSWRPGICWPIWSRCSGISGCPPPTSPPGCGTSHPTTRRIGG